MADSINNLNIQVPQAGDGGGLARTWLNAAKSYVELNAELFQMPDTNELVQWCEDCIIAQPSENNVLRVAEYDHQVIGFIRATIHLPVTDGHRQFVRDVNMTRLMIDALVVQQAYWRHGVGRRLMVVAEEWGEVKARWLPCLTPTLIVRSLFPSTSNG